MEMSSRPRERERTVVATMIRVYCRGSGHGGRLCDDCTELLNYARARIEACPFADSKPFCSQCEIHCYEKDMRERIRRVMRFSGPRMLLYHPLVALRHLADQLIRPRGE
jgi:hypothetical protein